MFGVTESIARSSLIAVTVPDMDTVIRVVFAPKRIFWFDRQAHCTVESGQLAEDDVLATGLALKPLDNGFVAHDLGGAVSRNFDHKRLALHFRQFPAVLTDLAQLLLRARERIEATGEDDAVVCFQGFLQALTVVLVSVVNVRCADHATRCSGRPT